MVSLKDKVALVTGSSLGIERETAFKFAKETKIKTFKYNLHYNLSVLTGEG